MEEDDARPTDRRMGVVMELEHWRMKAKTLEVEPNHLNFTDIPTSIEELVDLAKLNGQPGSLGLPFIVKGEISGIVIQAAADSNPRRLFMSFLVALRDGNKSVGPYPVNVD